ncbi:MAG TPA: type II secretion system protein GspC [bacterium]|jgi:general secretion pathway protein C|nr:type II secretion system protein GspC [bacterium]HPY13808.1 type II secretion system protein GspC [bacterium]HQB08860.1 type II secretion system protein GspC [bacterium]HQM83522.1 type II secretion system protein GspC [bacterium]
MKSRTILNVGLFISITFAIASTVGFLLSFVVKDEQVFVPIGKSYYRNGLEEDTEARKESFYFGSNVEKVSSSNIFDAAMRNITVADNKVGETTGDGAVPEASADDIYFYFENPEKCPLMSSLLLSGTIVAKEFDQSIAILREGSSREEGAIIARVGSEVTPGVKLALVWRNFVVLTTSSGVKCIGEGVGGDAKQSVPDQRFAQTGEPPVAGNDGIEVRKVGENQYVIRRQDLQKVTGNLNSLARQARIVPSKKDNGFKVFSITKDSLYSKIGIQNGDVIKSINGIELSSPDKALEAYSRLQSASKLSLDIVRRGQNETMEYTIE